MNNMKIGIVFVGKIYTPAAEERKVTGYDLSDPEKLNYITDEAFKQKYYARLAGLMPKYTETFCYEV